MTIRGWVASSYYARARNSALPLAMLYLACAYARASADAGNARLVAALRDPSAQVRADAAAALVKAGPAAVPELVAAIKGESSREAITRLLRKIGPKAVPELIDLLKTPELRNKAGAALFQVAGPASVDQTPALLGCLHDPAVNNYCGTALIKTMGPQAEGQVSRLVKALGDSDKTVRLYAAAALGQIGPKAAAKSVPALVRILKDPEPTVRGNAAMALGKMGKAAVPAIPALKAAARGAHDEPLRLIEEALEKIRG